MEVCLFFKTVNRQTFCFLPPFPHPNPPILPDKGLHPEGGYSNISTSDFLYSEVMINMT